jgi:hypothetical protein
LNHSLLPTCYSALSRKWRASSVRVRGITVFVGVRLANDANLLARLQSVLRPALSPRPVPLSFARSRRISVSGVSAPLHSVSSHEGGGSTGCSLCSLAPRMNGWAAWHELANHAHGIGALG